MNIGSTLLKYGIKAAGVAGIGVVLYDAHRHALHTSLVNRKVKNADAMDKWFDNTRYQNSPSKFNLNLKNGIFKLEARNNLRGWFNAGVGYVKGFTSMLAQDILPLGLSVAALATKGKTSSKIAGGALGVYALYGFVKNVLGFGLKPVDNNGDPM